MTEVFEYKQDQMVWPKGATMWGEALPYLRDEGGKQLVVYADWWTLTRLALLTLWVVDSSQALRLVLGHDQHQRIRATGREAREDLEARGQLNVKAMNAWAPDPVQAARIDERVRGYAETREWVRSRLSEARSRFPDIVEDLPGEPETWCDVQMAAAAMRLPRLLMDLVRLDLIPDPGVIVPERALLTK